MEATPTQSYPNPTYDLQILLPPFPTGKQPAMLSRRPRLEETPYPVARVSRAKRDANAQRDIAFYFAFPHQQAMVWQAERFYPLRLNPLAPL